MTEPPPFEINKKEVKATLSTFLDHGVVGLRHPNKWALFRLSAGIMAGFRATLTGLGFTEVQTPKLVASATESGANVFKVDYFGRAAESVNYCTEAPFIQQLGCQTIVMGPGHITQAHQPDEYLDLSFVKPTTAVLQHLIRRFCI